MDFHHTNGSLGKYVTRHTSGRKNLTKTKPNSNAGYIGIRGSPVIRLVQRHRMDYVPDAAVESIPSESERLHDLVEGSHHTLLNVKTVFPFVLFPDTLHIDRKKLTLVHQYSFFTAKTISVPLDDILNVEANIGPLFGSLILTSKYFKNNTQSINFLHRKDAIKAQLLLQGHMVVYHEKIDCSNIDTEELIAMLTDLGQSSINARRVH
jgi:hypothetical protein